MSFKHLNFKIIPTKKKSSSQAVVKEIKRRTRRHYSAEEKIRLVLEGSAWRRFDCGSFDQLNLRVPAFE